MSNTWDTPTIGDVIIVASQELGEVTGVVVDNTCETGWLDILLEDGKLIKWPSSQMKVVPDELSDKQLESVVGGMSFEQFSEWRARIINEDR